MRKLTNLYEIIIENISLLDSGICDLLNKLYRLDLITMSEYNKLWNHFHKCKPSKKRKFRNFTHHESWSYGMFQWRPREEEQRRKFLIALREYSKPWYNKIWWI